MNVRNIQLHGWNHWDMDIDQTNQARCSCMETFTPAVIAYESVVPHLWLIWWSTTVKHFLWTFLGVIKALNWVEKWLVTFQKVAKGEALKPAIEPYQK